MADTPETPDTSEPAKPAAARRRAPRKAPASRPAKAKATPPASASEAASQPAPKRASPPKPRSTNRAKPPAQRRAAAPKPSEKTLDQQGSRIGWGKAAVAGGLAALGAAATAALFSLRGSTAKPKSAHTPDGRDASRSFHAGIADENSIPDKD